MIDRIGRLVIARLERIYLRMRSRRDEARRQRSTASASSMMELVGGLVRGEWALLASYDEQGRRVFVARRSSGAVGVQKLSRWEQRMLRSIGLGLSDAHIARELHINAASVGRHLARIQRKLGLSSHADLMRVAVGLQLAHVPTGATGGGLQ